jgi:4-diphosphocytidyl-2C-methyl-D-erythritol kinase
MNFGIILLLSYIAQTVFNICICYSRYDNFEELKDKLINEEGLGCVMMTGSGSTVFALSSNKKVLFKVFEKYFESKDYKIEFCKTL